MDMEGVPRHAACLCYTHVHTLEISMKMARVVSAVVLHTLAVMTFASHDTRIDVSIVLELWMQNRGPGTGCECFHDRHRGTQTM